MGGIRSVLLTGFLCLVLASAGAALWIERYEQTGPVLLVENWAVVDPDAGQVLRENNIWSLIAGDPEKSVRLQQTIAPKAGCKRVRLSADLRWENVTAGDKPWHKARLVLAQYDAEGKWLKRAHVAAAVSGSGKWRNYSKVFDISPRARRIKVGVELNHSTGTLWVKNAGLHGVEQRVVHAWTARLFLGAWSVFFLFLLGACLAVRKGRFVLKALGALIFVAIVAGTTMPGETKDSLKYEVSRQVQSIGADAGAGDLIQSLPFDITKVGHFGLFALFGLLLAAEMRFYEVLTVLLLLAAGTELIQLFIDGRTPLAGDFVIDAAGGAAGMLLKYCHSEFLKKFMRFRRFRV